MRMVVVTWIVAIALMVCVGCDLAGPESLPIDPGTVVVRVSDEARAPLRDVWVYVVDVPNRVGSTYTVGSRTDAAGVATLPGIPAGERHVDVKPPAGFAAPERLTVGVVKGVTVSLPVVLRRE